MRGLRVERRDFASGRPLADNRSGLVGVVYCVYYGVFRRLEYTVWKSAFGRVEASDGIVVRGRLSWASPTSRRSVGRTHEMEGRSASRVIHTRRRLSGDACSALGRERARGNAPTGNDRLQPTTGCSVQLSDPPTWSVVPRRSDLLRPACSCSGRRMWVRHRHRAVAIPVPSTQPEYYYAL